MIYSDLYTLVRNLLSDAESVSNTWSDEQIADSVNFACKEYVKKTRATRERTSSTVTLEGEFPAPTDCLELIHIQYLNKELIQTDRDFEAIRSATWETDKASSTKRWLYFGGDTGKLVPALTGWTPVSAQVCVTGSSYTIKAIGSTTWSSLGATGSVTGVTFVCTTGGTTGSGNGTAYPLSYWPTCVIDYTQKPTACSVTGAIAIASLVTGSTYSISSTGASGFVAVGAASETLGTVFVATGANGATGATGYAQETLDQRIPPEHHEYLQYAAATYLLKMFNDQQNAALADKYLADFNALIGPMKLS